MHNPPKSIFYDAQGKPIEGSWIDPSKHPFALALKDANRRVCDSCRKGGACGCVLAGPQVTC